MVNLEEQFSLKWNNFQSNLATGFHHLLQEEVMVDVTLAAGGYLVQAHKIVLSVCSSYFKNLFQVNPCNHPIVILKDVGSQELSDMLDFMYRGEANVSQENLAAFLKLAETLNVKGLAVNESEEDDTSQPSEDSIDDKPNSVRKKLVPMDSSFGDSDKESKNPDLKTEKVHIPRKRKRKSRSTSESGESTSIKKDSKSEESAKRQSKEAVIDVDMGDNSDMDDYNEMDTAGDDFGDVSNDNADVNAGPSSSDDNTENLPTVTIPHSYMVRFKYDHNPIWDFFLKDKENQRAICEHCQRPLIFKRGSTSSLINHLKRFHVPEFHLYAQQRDYFHEQRREKLRETFAKKHGDPRTILHVDMNSTSVKTAKSDITTTNNETSLTVEEGEVT